MLISHFYVQCVVDVPYSIWVAFLENLVNDYIISIIVYGLSGDAFHDLVNPRT